MSEVTRYDLIDHNRGMESWREMEERADGDYVKFEDFDLATKARDGVFSQIVKSLTEEREAALATIAERDSRIAELEPQQSEWIARFSRCGEMLCDPIGGDFQQIEDAVRDVMMELEGMRGEKEEAERGQSEIAELLNTATRELAEAKAEIARLRSECFKWAESSDSYSKELASTLAERDQLQSESTEREALYQFGYAVSVACDQRSHHINESETKLDAIRRWSLERVNALAEATELKAMIAAKDEALTEAADTLETLRTFYRNHSTWGTIECDKVIAETRAALTSDIAKLFVRREALEKLVDATQRLRDWQNGCPLPSYEEEWTRAMEDTLLELSRAEAELAKGAKD